MSLLNAAVLAASEGHELAPLIAPAPVIAGVMAVLFIALGLVTVSYRDVANRAGHRQWKNAEPGDHTHGGQH